MGNRFLVTAVLVAAAFCCTCSRDQNTDVRPVLKNLMVQFAPYDSITGKAGDFIFRAEDQKEFCEFGAIVDMGHLLPNFEYRIDSNAALACPLDGEVENIIYQTGTNDYEIWIAPAAGSKWLCILDHVRGTTLTKGEHVSAGQIIGKPGPWSSFQGRSELQVNNPDGEYQCPMLFVDSSVKADVQEKITRLMHDWEVFKGDTTIYGEDTMICAGCNAERYPASTQ
jgi:hypothetical protein